MSRRLAPALPRLLLASLGAAFRRPGVILLLLLLNLGVALVVAVPLKSLLSAELDDNLYGEVMEEGASWRWFDTVEREHPQAVGDYSPWTAFFTADGVGLADLAAVSGPAATLLLAGLLIFLIQAPLHVGYLAAAPGSRATAAGGWRRRAWGIREVVGAGVARAPAALILAVGAGCAYAAVYALLFVAPAAHLERFADFLHSAPSQLAQTWLRLVLTFLALMVVKVFFDLAKLGLAGGAAAGSGDGVADGSVRFGGLARLPAALKLALREGLRRGWAYLAVDLVLVALMLVLALLWWWLSGPLVPATWLGIAILFVLHQLFLALRIGLRLAHLDAARDIQGWAVERMVDPPSPTAAPAPATPPPPRASNSTADSTHAEGGSGDEHRKEGT